MITVHQQPVDYSPAYNDLTYVVTSDNTAQDNFKFLCDVYVNSNKIATIPSSPHPDYATGIFNVSRFVSDYITNDIPIASTLGAERASNSFVVLQCKFGEQYGPASAIVNYPNLTLSSSVYPYAACLDELTFIDYNENTYRADEVFPGKFLTNKPRPHQIRKDQNDWLTIYSEITDAVRLIVCVTYDRDGNVIQTGAWNNTFNTIPSDSNRFIRFCSGYNINEIEGMVTGTQPLLDDNVYYYTLATYTGAIVQTSEMFTTYIKECETWHTPYTIHWQNQLGFFDSYRFTGFSTKNSNIERSEYKKTPGTYGANSFTRSKQDRGTKTYFTMSKDVWTMRSGVLTDEEVPWLLELIQSPEVYIEIDNELIAINIVKNNYEQITKEINEVPFLEVQVKYALDNYRQTS
jgi:hypothetical protein